MSVNLSPVIHQISNICVQRKLVYDLESKNVNYFKPDFIQSGYNIYQKLMGLVYNSKLTKCCLYDIDRKEIRRLFNSFEYHYSIHNIKIINDFLDLKDLIKNPDKVKSMKNPSDDLWFIAIKSKPKLIKHHKKTSFEFIKELVKSHPEILNYIKKTFSDEQYIALIESNEKVASDSYIPAIHKYGPILKEYVSSRFFNIVSNPYFTVNLKIADNVIKLLINSTDEDVFGNSDYNRMIVLKKLLSLDLQPSQLWAIEHIEPSKVKEHRNYNKVASGILKVFEGVV